MNLRASRAATDPSRFLECLQTTIRRVGDAEFLVNSQHDAADVLRYIFNEVACSAITAFEHVLGRFQTLCSCSSRNISNVVEDNFSILALPITDSIQHSLTSLLSQ